MRQNCSIKNCRRLKKKQLPGLDSAAPCPLVLTGPPGFTVATSAGDLELQSNPAPRSPQRPAPPHTPHLSQVFTFLPVPSQVTVTFCYCIG